MSFKPFDFTFTPPRTVPAPTPTSAPVGSTGPTVGGPDTGAQSQAGQLITKLDELTAMSQYLQDAIVARTNTMAVEIDPSIDPNTARALTSIYGTDTPPTSITIPMYNQLLDAHLGALQLEMAVGNDSTIQANPLQVGDLITVISAIDQHLIASGSYKTWLPLQLASLKADSILFQSWKASLQQYPAYYITDTTISSTQPTFAIQAAGLDIEGSLAGYENDVINHMGQSYSVVYQTMASVHSVEADINNVMFEYFYQPLGNILRIVALFNALKGLTHKPTMETLQGDFINYSLARLGSDVSSMLHTSDLLVKIAVAPLQGTLGSLGRIAAGAQAQAAEIGFLAGGGLAGLSKANACASTNPYNKIHGTSGKTLTIPGLGKISDGLKYLAEKLNWASNSATLALAQIDKSFRQLLERRMKQQDDRNELMCSMRALDALIGIGVGVAHEFQKGTVTANSSPQQKQEASGRILTSLQTGSDTTFVADGNTIVANPPDMPPVSAPVRNVLGRAKIRTTIGRIEA